ncbi:MAG: hypothetical protein GEU81_09120 [Nitriliruptorales bacterium]|nr:hypothetical protein [Nitriliruptorales bacterium]
MTRLTQALGVLLVVIGLLAYVISDAASVTALLPALAGVVILVLGVVAAREAPHRHAIHGALVVALLAGLGSLMQVAELPALLTDAGVERPTAVVAGTLTFLACAVYVGLGVRSFVAARRTREATSAT